MRKIIILASIFLAALALAFKVITVVNAQQWTMVDDLQVQPPALSITHNGEELTSIVIHSEDGSPAVTIRPDGTVETTKEPKEAARLFWNAIAGYLHQCSGTKPK